MGVLINISGILYILPQKKSQPTWGFRIPHVFPIPNINVPTFVPRSRSGFPCHALGGRIVEGVPDLGVPWMVDLYRFHVGKYHNRPMDSVMGIDDMDETTKKIAEKSIYIISWYFYDNLCLILRFETNKWLKNDGYSMSLLQFTILEYSQEQAISKTGQYKRGWDQLVWNPCYIIDLHRVTPISKPGGRILHPQLWSQLLLWF